MDAAIMSCDLDGNVINIQLGATGSFNRQQRSKQAESVLTNLVDYGDVRKDEQPEETDKDLLSELQELAENEKNELSITIVQKVPKSCRDFDHNQGFGTSVLQETWDGGIEQDKLVYKDDGDFNQKDHHEGQQVDCIVTGASEKFGKHVKIGNEISKAALMNAACPSADEKASQNVLTLPKEGHHLAKYFSKKALAQQDLDEASTEFVGLQYILEVHRYPEPGIGHPLNGPRDVDIECSSVHRSYSRKTVQDCYYVCVQCLKQISTVSSLIRHVKSLPHKLAFAKLHFPDATADHEVLPLLEWKPATYRAFKNMFVKKCETLGMHQVAVCDDADYESAAAAVQSHLGHLSSFPSLGRRAATRPIVTCSVAPANSPDTTSWRLKFSVKGHLSEVNQVETHEQLERRNTCKRARSPTLVQLATGGPDSSFVQSTEADIEKLEDVFTEDFCRELQKSHQIKNFSFSKCTSFRKEECSTRFSSMHRDDPSTIRTRDHDQRRKPSPHRLCYKNVTSSRRRRRVSGNFSPTLRSKRYDRSISPTKVVEQHMQGSSGLARLENPQHNSGIGKNVISTAYEQPQQLDGGLQKVATHLRRSQVLPSAKHPTSCSFQSFNHALTAQIPTDDAELPRPASLALESGHGLLPLPPSPTLEEESVNFDIASILKSLADMEELSDVSTCITTLLIASINYNMLNRDFRKIFSTAKSCVAVKKIYDEIISSVPRSKFIPGSSLAESFRSISWIIDEIKTEIFCGVDAFAIADDSFELRETSILKVVKACLVSAECPARIMQHASDLMMEVIKLIHSNDKDRIKASTAEKMPQEI
ncbi:Zinc finger C2H2-type [Trinorchestia longiramus]|nr:Zinc finger C2H2-type [Trinorchestia longiramus]